MATRTKTTINQGVGGDSFDEFAVTDPDTSEVLKREIVVFAGGEWGDPVQPTNAAPASNVYALPVRQVPTISTAAVSAIPASVANTTIAADNPDRLSGMIYNDSTSTLRIKYGATASATDYTDKLLRDGRHVILPGHTGRIDGIWESAPMGAAARLTEITKT